jgi:hypothetical protein
MKREFSRQIFEESSNNKFQQNPSNGSRVRCGQTDMTKPTVAFRNSANAPKKGKDSLQLKLTDLQSVEEPKWNCCQIFFFGSGESVNEIPNTVISIISVKKAVTNF